MPECRPLPDRSWPGLRPLYPSFPGGFDLSPRGTRCACTPFGHGYPGSACTILDAHMDPNTDHHAEFYAQPDQYTHTNPYRDPERNPDADEYSESYFKSDFDAISDSHQQPDKYTHAHAEPDADPHAN